MTYTSITSPPHSSHMYISLQNITLQHILANSLQTSTKQLLHILILCKLFWKFWSIFEKEKKIVTKTKQKKKREKKKRKRQGKRKEKKKEKERNRRSEKKENKLEEYLLPPPSLPFPSIPIIHHHPHHLGAKLSYVVPPLLFKIHFVYTHICF